LPMKTTDFLLELLKYVLPAGMVLGAVALVLRESRQKAEQKQRYSVFQGALNQIVPLRLQAHERLLIFLERIKFENLLMRVDGRGKNAKTYQVELIAEIRAEFEHNIAQQLYIDRETWEGIVRAKEHTIGFIHQTAQALPAEAGGSDLGKLLLREMVRTEVVPTMDAIGQLRRDVQKMFRFGAND
jgi:hypothetical protein